MPLKTWLPEYILQLTLALLAMILGFVLDMVVDRYYYSTPLRELGLCSIFIGGVAGYVVGRLRRRRVALLVWIAGLVWLLYTIYSLATVWNPTWAPTSRMAYVWNSLVGPGCGSQECIYTLATDLFLSLAAYSVGARLALRNLPKANLGRA